MPESRLYTLQNRDKALTAQKKKGAAADDSPPREHFRTMADSKMKHSYSLTSLSSRFLHGASSSSSTSGQQTNGHHAHNSLTNGHHGTVGNGNGNNSMMLNGKEGVELLDGSDDYGFLSYNTSRVERDNASKLSGPTSAKSLTSTLRNNSNFSLGTSNHNGNGGGVVGSGSFYSTATYGRLKHSSQQQAQQQQQQQQQLHHPQCQHHHNNSNGNGGVGGRQSKLRNGSVAPICACDCHLTMGNASNNGIVGSSVVSSGNGISSSNNGTNTIGSRTSSNSSSGSGGGGGIGVGSNGSSSTATTSSSSSSSNESNKINGFTSSLLNGVKKDSVLNKSFGSSTLASGASAAASSSSSSGGGGGGVNSTSKYEMLRNNFFGSGITRERDPKLNSSCQALNLCANNNGSSSNNNNNGTSNGNASSMFGASSINSTVSNNTNNNDSLMNGLVTGSSGAPKVGSRTAGTRVRRTISCYAKNPSKLDSLENNLSQQAAGFGIAEKDYLGSSMMNMSSANNSTSHLHHHHHHLTNGHHHHGSINGFIAATATSAGLNNNNGHGGGLGASTASIVHYQPGPAAGPMNGHHHHHHLSSATAPGVVAGGPSFPNPICEFSPFSSMSSTDLIGLRMTNGFGAGGLDRRYVGSNGSANFTVYFHDNPIDCGCSTCFQVKLNIFQASHKKPSPAVSNSNNNNKGEGSSGGGSGEAGTNSPITTNGNNNLTTSTANFSSKTQDSDISWPLTPEEAVGCFASRLTAWKLQEIVKYPQIWYVGHEAVRKINGDKTNPLNSAFDDENGNYIKVTRDHIGYRYEILEVIGKGSFGQVIRATDHKTQSQVAIKIIRNKKRFHAQALVEVKILEHLRKRDHDNTVIRMYSSFYFRNHLCIVFELMSLNLYELIRRNHYQGFSTGLIRKFAVSLLKCLSLLKRENIIHCDLKPVTLLTGTLRTYQKASCDGEYMALRCPMGTTISVQLAQYGKTAPSPALCSTNSNTHPELMDIVDGYGNVTCHWPTAIQTVVGLCQKKTSCKFQTSPGTFGGDPCPGSRKYVEVAYKCRPSEFKSVIGCDSEVIQLKCNRSSRLAIYSANYGRTEYESVQCPQPKGVHEESCLSSFATENVMQMCHGKRRCALGVNPATFGTPCKPESKMYLKVIHTCVPRKVLKEKYQGELEPDEMFEDETEYESGDPVGGVVEQPSIYSPDHSRDNPKSTMKPSLSSKSRSSPTYHRPRIYQQGNHNQFHDTNSQLGPTSIAHSSNTLTRHINQQGKVEEQGQSDFDSGKIMPSQNLFPKARYNFPQEYDEGATTRSHNDNKKNAAIFATTVTSSRNFRNSPGTNHSQDDLRLIYVISQGIRAYDFLSRNKESLWLYVTISIASALLVVIFVILVKIYVQRSTSREARRAANLTTASSKPSSSSAGPITSTGLSDIDELSVVTDEVTELPSILRHGSPGDELDLQTSSTTHLISSSNNSNVSASNNPLSGGGIGGSPSILTSGFNNSVGADMSGEGSLLLGGGGGGGSIMNTTNPYITSGSATMGRKTHHLQQQQQHHHQQLLQQQQNHPSSTYMTMTTYGMPMVGVSGGGSGTAPLPAVSAGQHYSHQIQNQNQQQQLQGGTNPTPSSTIPNPSTMTLGRTMSGGSSSRPRDSNLHFYYD